MQEIFTEDELQFELHLVLAKVLAKGLTLQRFSPCCPGDYAPMQLDDGDAFLEGCARWRADLQKASDTFEAYAANEDAENGENDSVEMTQRLEDALLFVATNFKNLWV